jgi:hypothetical protein
VGDFEFSRDDEAGENMTITGLAIPVNSTNDR